MADQEGVSRDRQNPLPAPPPPRVLISYEIEINYFIFMTYLRKMRENPIPLYTDGQNKSYNRILLC